MLFEDADVTFGAAIHDIGKSRVPTELSEPGRAHETLGAEILINLGMSAQRARFAATHGSWSKEKSLPIEDLLVSLADNCWKAKRVPDLEEKVVEEISRVTNRPQWEVFASLDSILENLAADADQRLAWQAKFPV